MLQAALPGILDRFYDRVRQQPELAAKFRTSEAVARAKAAQAAHWSRLFDDQFDDAYCQSAAQIGLAHFRVDLRPAWYIAAYGAVLAELLHALVGQRGTMLGRRQRQESSAAQQAVVRAVLLDMNMALSAYWAELAAERSKAIDAMITRIGEQVGETAGDIGQYSGDLRQNIVELTAFGTQVGHDAEEATTAATVALDSAESVARGVEQLPAAIAEITTQVSRSAGTARNAVGGMEEAREVVGQLGAAGDQIGQVVQLISSLAAQTNLLALNATIEAARAGEAGKGFAVVAGEVKSLATQSARSASDIAERISRIQEVTQSTIQAIDRAARTIGETEQVAVAVSAAVEQQSAATAETARHIAQTAEQAQRVNRLMQTVRQSAGKAAQATAVVDDAARQMDTMVARMGTLLNRALRTSSQIADRRRERRRATMIDADLSAEGRTVQAVIHDLSELGAKVTAAQSFPGHAAVTLAIPAEGLRLAAKVIAVDDDTHHLAFTACNLASAKVDAMAGAGVFKLIERTKEDHRVWVGRIADTLAGKAQTTAASVSSRHTCRLGR